MDGELEELRGRVVAARRLIEGGRKGKEVLPYREAVRELKRPLSDYYARRRLEGATVKRIAGELGLPPGTLRRWVGLEKRPWRNARERFFEIEIGTRVLQIGGLSAPAPPAQMDDEEAEGSDTQGAVLILPGGLRVEGVSLKNLPGLLGEEQ